ncbi:hypothetical protein D3C78_909000 [compost metagenome]
MDHLTVLAQVAVFEAGVRLATHDFPGSVQGPLTVGRVHHLDHLLADQLILGVTEHLLAGSTDKDKASLAVDGTYDVEQQIDVTGQRCGISGGHVGWILSKNAAMSISPWTWQSLSAGALLQLTQPCVQPQVLFASRPGTACSRALMAKPMNITPQIRVIASS